ncbi:hypothetical protein [Pontibacter sp. G13]|uniref:hypothetical protein n=1 Tax=Pontibacter sp. G13 TaxID=3074898 RepID=UPI00288A002E|nr:hypothetical protein [Pontibacter sp. G13]WNJ16658.1 hypothetical protein RJD25_17470 [Pontibacter sp. G13]
MKQLYVLGLLLVWITGIQAQNRIPFIERTPTNAVREVLYFQNYLYVGAGNYLKVFDATNLDNYPFPLVFEHRFASTVEDVHLYRGYLYIAAKEDGISKWQVNQPYSPELLAHIRPESHHYAAYDMSFKGDTIFLANKSSVALYRITAESLTYMQDFATLEGSGSIRGGALRDSLYAFVVGQGGSDNGVYIYDNRTLEEWSSFPQPYCDPQDAFFGDRTELLHIVGGAADLDENPDAKGCLFTLDIADPDQPELAFQDTLKTLENTAFPIPLNGEIMNDTIFISTQYAKTTVNGVPDTLEGHVYVYDATDPGNIERIVEMYGGLWHFDLSLQDTLIDIASEYYGLPRIAKPGREVPVRQFATTGGGWIYGSAIHGDTLALSGGGYGYLMFDIRDLESITNIVANSDTTLPLRSIEFSDNGNFMYGVYDEEPGFRVLDVNGFVEVANLPGNYGGSKTFAKDGLFATLIKPEVGPRQLVVLNVQNPLEPFIDTIFNYVVKDFLIDDGFLVVATKDSLLVYDGFEDLRLRYAYPAGLVAEFSAIAKDADTLYAYHTREGMHRFTLYPQGMVLDTAIKVGEGIPSILTVDEYGLYSVILGKGIYAFDKHTLEQTSSYGGSLEYLHQEEWAPQKLIAHQGNLYLIEVFSLPTVLSNQSGILEKVDQGFRTRGLVTITPNPFMDRTTIRFPNPRNLSFTLQIWDLEGNVKRIIPDIRENEYILDREQLKVGTYLYALYNAGERLAYGKLFVIGY